jgi:CHAT domain-containing protein
MNPMKVSGRLLLFFAVIFCFLQTETPPGNFRVKGAAGQSTAARDRAVSVEDREKALRDLQASVHQSLLAGQIVQAARDLNRAGRLQLLISDTKAALASHQQALDLLKQSPASDAEVDNLNGLALCYLHLAQKQPAQEALKKSLALSEQSGYIRGQAEGLLILSDKQNHENHLLALETARKALELWQNLGDKEGLARAHDQIGTCYLALNALSEAAQSHERALELARELNQSSEQAEALINLGYIEYRRGEWQGSISYYTQAQGLLDEKAEPLKMGQIASGLGAAFNENGLPENGVIQFQRALDYYRQTQNPDAVRYAMWSLGRTHYLLGEFPQAITYLQQSLDGIDRNSFQAASPLQYLGRVHIAQADYAAAQEELRSAFAIYTKAENSKEAAQVQALIGQIYDRQGEITEARRYYNEALQVFTRLSDRVNQATVYSAWGQLELKSGNLEAAEAYLHQALELTENLRRASTSSDLTVAFSATVSERYESYIECLMRMHQAQPNEGLAARAFETSELARGRSLVDLLRATQTNLVPGLDPQLASREKELRQALRVKEDSKVQLLGKAYRKEDLDAVEAELTKLEAEYKKITVSIRAAYPAYEQLARTGALSLRQIQEQVIPDDQTMLLEYSLGEAKSFLWAVGRTSISSYELPGRAEIENAARRLYGSLTASQAVQGETFEQFQARTQLANAQLASETAALSRLLLAPIADKLGVKRLLIVADGYLQYIPFQVLTAPSLAANATDANAPLEAQRPLMLDHEIINEISASTLALVLDETAKRTTASRSVAILADPVFETDDPRLTSRNSAAQQGSLESAKLGTVTRALRDVGVDQRQVPRLIASRQEADAIMAFLPWFTALKATDFEASRGKVTTSDLGKYRIVHFATHALLNDKHPESSGIVLSLVDQKGMPQDGFLSLRDIYNLKLPVDLVVLSACQTGLGKDVKGEGLIGLTRGFMYAGAAGVVASLWKVDDDATAELMKHFYAGMFEKGLSPSAALREAQLALRQQKRWHEPFFWAGFVLQGQYNHRESMNRTPARIVAWATTTGGLAVALSLLIFFLKRRRNRIL